MTQPHTQHTHTSRRTEKETAVTAKTAATATAETDTSADHSLMKSMGRRRHWSGISTTTSTSTSPQNTPFNAQLYASRTLLSIVFSGAVESSMLNIRRPLRQCWKKERMAEGKNKNSSSRSSSLTAINIDIEQWKGSGMSGKRKRRENETENTERPLFGCLLKRVREREKSSSPPPHTNLPSEFVCKAVCQAAGRQTKQNENDDHDDDDRLQHSTKH